MKHIALFLLFAGCAANSPSEPGALVLVRPYDSNIPLNYDKSKPTPLVVLLHGFAQNAFVQNAYWGLTEASERHGFLLAFPDGTKNASGDRFWNATDACCDFGGSGVDDVAYLNAVIDDMVRQYNVDKKRIYFTGHSNGGFMSYRMACDASDRVAAVAPLAGAMWKDLSKCNPTATVSVLHVHGDQDDDVPYAGEAAAPGATASLAMWAAKNGCDPTLGEVVERLDVDDVLPGSETSVRRHACARGAAEHWRIEGAGHVPNFKQPEWGDALWSWFSAHPKL